MENMKVSQFFQYFKQTLELQNTFNSEINKDWKSQSTYKWDVAMFVELGELLASTGYKHWKNEEFDLKNVKMEIVDVYHFWLSWFLSKENLFIYTTNVKEQDKLKEKFHVTDIEFEKLLQIYYSENLLDFNPLINTVNENKEIKEIFIQKIKKEIFKFNQLIVEEKVKESFYSLLKLIHICFYDFEEFFSLYLAKNALNKFRQKNGYKEGTYKKQWFDGREDNYHVIDIIEKIKNNKEESTCLNLDYILSKMQSIYETK